MQLRASDTVDYSSQLSSKSGVVTGCAVVGAGGGGVGVEAGAVDVTTKWYFFFRLTIRYIHSRNYVKKSLKIL